MMLNIGLITDIAFWEIANGQNSRISALYSFLAHYSKLTLYYLGEGACPFLSPTFQCKDITAKIADYLRKAKHDLIIVEKLRLDWITELGLKGSRIYLDAHDIVSERAKAFQQFNRQCAILSFEEEMSRFSKFDKVILLQKDEVDKVLPWMGLDRVLLCPHPVVSEQNIPIRKRVKTIGFLGGPSYPNIDGIQWFHDAILPLLGNLAQKCIVHGVINCSPFLIYTPNLSKGRLFSSVANYYKVVDIAINPVLYGSGLKIKTVEALAYGIPLVTTSVGAQGLTKKSNRLFLLADTPQEFAHSLFKLTSSYTLRSELSKSSRSFAKLHFTPHACFNTLLKA